MLKSLENTEDIKPSKLYFSVSKKEDLFYEERLKALKNVEVFIHLTQEKAPGYQEGRININNITTSSLDGEWYLCGNPKMVQEAKEKLRERGYTMIRSEEFHG
jgi:NAD(P)H-flavin reductase